LLLLLLLALQVSSVVLSHFRISCQGLLDVAALQELLAPAGLLADEQAVSDVCVLVSSTCSLAGTAFPAPV
jgi:hypothetical protein